MHNVTIYSTPTCHYCHMAKEFFGAHGVKYTDRNAAADMQARQELVQKSGQMGVPVIDIDGHIVIGFDEEELRRLLEIRD